MPRKKAAKFSIPSMVLKFQSIWFAKVTIQAKRKEKRAVTQVKGFFEGIDLSSDDAVPFPKRLEMPKIATSK